MALHAAVYLLLPVLASFSSAAAAVAAGGSPAAFRDALLSADASLSHLRRALSSAAPAHRPAEYSSNGPLRSRLWDALHFLSVEVLLGLAGEAGAPDPLPAAGRKAERLAAGLRRAGTPTTPTPPTPTALGGIPSRSPAPRISNLSPEGLAVGAAGEGEEWELTSVVVQAPPQEEARGGDTDAVTPLGGGGVARGGCAAGGGGAARANAPRKRGGGAIRGIALAAAAAAALAVVAITRRRDAPRRGKR